MRQCKDWLKSYLEYTERAESPAIFHLWTAISTLGMALGRKCYIDKGLIGKCYPNQYIILVAGTAKCAKTTAANIGIRLFAKAGIHPVMCDKVTTRVLSQELNDNQIKFGNSSLYIYAEELDTLFGADSYKTGLFALLTDLYGCQDEKSYRTATQGVDIYKNVYVNILACTIPAWLENAQYLTEGGFAGRILFVYANNPRAANPNPRTSLKEAALEKSLLVDLQQIALISGEFTRTSEADDFYSQWYLMNHITPSPDERLDGYFNRKRDHVNKLGMIISASERDDRIITVEHLKRALKFLDDIEKVLSHAFVGVSYSGDTKFVDRILHYLRNNGGKMEHSKLLKAMTHYTPAKQFRELMETLLESDSVKAAIDAKGKRVYTLRK